MTQKPVILVTGFGAFPGQPSNPTQKMINAIAADMPGVYAHVLPTEYGAGTKALNALLDKLKPDIVICFGVAAKSGTIRLETSARNEVSVKKEDAAGFKPASPVITAGGAAQKPSTLPLEVISHALWQQELPAVFSASAGDYVCNHTFYSLMQRREKSGDCAVAGFVHVPNENAPGFSAEKLLKAAKTIIASTAAHYDANIRPLPQRSHQPHPAV